MKKQKKLKEFSPAEYKYWSNQATIAKILKLNGFPIPANATFLMVGNGEVWFSNATQPGQSAVVSYLGRSR